jgi:hypothetical protein
VETSSRAAALDEKRLGATAAAGEPSSSMILAVWCAEIWNVTPPEDCGSGELCESEALAGGDSAMMVTRARILAWRAWSMASSVYTTTGCGLLLWCWLMRVGGGGA